MKISELKTKLIEFIHDKRDEIRLMNLLKTKKDEIHLSDLDYALLFIELGFAPALEEKYIDIICDSEFAKLLAPDSFESGQHSFDDEQTAKNIKNEITHYISEQKFPVKAIEAIKEHEIIGEVNLDIITSSQATFINLQNNISIEAYTSGFYSFALSQTGFRILSAIILTNTSETPVLNSVLKIRSTPDYVTIADIKVPLLNPHQPVQITDFNINVDIDKLLELKEKIAGSLTFSLEKDGAELSTLVTEMTYFSYDTMVERIIPGSTALFVMPNEESVKNIVRLTAKTLQDETGRSALTDYQSDDRKDVYEQVKALYDTLRQQGIGYITSPASFEFVGQKIRIPHEVLVGKQGTCIDLSILMVSCLESMGLNAGLVIITGHAYACVFLDDTSFPSSPYIDATKALDFCDNEKNLIFIECTAFCAGATASFEEAVSRGRLRTQTSIADGNFEIIDIPVARADKYLPLPISFDDVEKITIDLKVVEENKERLKKKGFSSSKETVTLTKAELNKFDIWEKKLLDLSKRNELIDFKVDKYGQQILTYEAEGSNFNVNSLYQVFKDKNHPCYITDSLYPCILGTLALSDDLMTEDVFNKYNEAASNHNLLIVKRKTPLNTALKYFDRERKKAFEESGSNILYLAIGFIEWFETAKSIKPKYAPVILMPVDLKRHSKDSYSLVGREEPAFLNISIFEFFHQEFGMNFDDLLTNDLFYDENANVDAILNTVSEKLKRLNRTRVLKTAAINIFRFSKAVMWQDIKYNRGELVKNKVIKSIIERSYIASEEEKLSDDFDDDSFNPSDFAIPLSADSSQIKAIKDCAAGRSFILQGPPGTGKSQTITNMIVNAIYHGKTVLFVAEKMAALEVVQKRLAKLNLDRFALEIHSIKADKTNVMEQFKKRIDLQNVLSNTDEFEKTANNLKEKQTEINKVINLLHRKNEYFISFYDAFVRLLDLPEGDFFAISFSHLNGLSATAFKDNLTLLSNLYHLILENDGYKNNPFILYRSSEYKPHITKNKIREIGPRYKSAIDRYLSSLDKFLDSNNISVDKNRTTISKLITLLQDEHISSCNPSYFQMNLLNSGMTIGAIQKGKEYSECIKKFKNDFSPSILNYDAEQAKFELEKSNNLGFFAKHKTQGKLLKEMQSYAMNPKSINLKSLDNIYEELLKLKGLKTEFEASKKLYPTLFEGTMEDISTIDFDALQQNFKSTSYLYDNYHLTFDTNQLIAIVSGVKNEILLMKEEFISAYHDLMNIEKECTDMGFDFSLCEKYHFTYDDIRNMIARWPSRIDYLNSFCFLNGTIDKLHATDLDFMMDYVDGIDDTKSLPDLSKVYARSIYSTIINEVLSKDSGSFNTEALRHGIDEYKSLINDFNRLSIYETAARITANTPVMNERSSSSSEIGILRTAVGNKCRGKSMRQLFSETSHIITKYFPVFLMSPISCAQFLGPKISKFDIVIFDEASQMPTSEAIGAISRGNSLIVVGDSMQMPPTAFFQSKGSDEYYADIEDQESILDDCDVIGMPSRQLDWHYRSKHESLIRFSNARFYHNSLVTFPSPNDMVTKVSLRNVKGVYDRKGKNTNEKEATEIIKEIERRLKSDELIKKSIGIVTFSSSQQELIEDKLEDFWLKNKALEEKYKSLVEKEDNPLEPIIVKNLENIQGDERDVILFSVCYGPDKHGQMYFQFGPINKSGGEKRLNVAFSRARYEMVIFTSFDPSVMNQNKGASRGCYELAAFLRYAKEGGNSLPVDNKSLSNMPVGIERQIAKAIEEHGYKTQVDVGKSSFRVDIGVVDPNNPGRYILGIVCDSYSYEHASTSRDRNIVQPSVLNALGWNIMRVWSFDYLDDKEFVIKSILKKIEELKMNSVNETQEENNNLNIKYETEKKEFISYRKDYSQFTKQFKNITENHKSVEFYSVVKLLVEAIVKQESPISVPTLNKRVAYCIQAQRSGSDIQENVRNALKEWKYSRTITNGTEFAWSPDMDFNNLVYYRYTEEFARSIEEIPMEEIIVAMKEVLLNNGPILVTELKSETADCFGIKAVKSKVNEVLDFVIKSYTEKGVLVKAVDGVRIMLKGQVL